MPSAMLGESGRSAPQILAPGVTLWTITASPRAYRGIFAHNPPLPSFSSTLAMEVAQGFPAYEARLLEPSVQGRLA